MKAIKGFDYVANRPAELTLVQWRERLSKLIEKGGFRRVEAGETFGHNKAGIIEFEIYATVRAP